MSSAGVPANRPTQLAGLISRKLGLSLAPTSDAAGMEGIAAGLRGEADQAAEVRAERYPGGAVDWVLG